MTKYIVMYVLYGVTRQAKFTKERKADAIKFFREKKSSCERAVLFSIDSDDPEIWYDLSKNY